MRSTSLRARFTLRSLPCPQDFGTELMTPQMAASIGGPLPPGGVVHARLIAPLTSATTQKGEAVEAVISQPLLDGERHLILPQGSRLEGTARQVQPARRMKKNGQLRIAFQKLIPPDGIAEEVEATVEGVQSGKDANVKLDSEGGAKAVVLIAMWRSVSELFGVTAQSGRTTRKGERPFARSEGCSVLSVSV
jgi:hypothetical protein